VDIKFQLFPADFSAKQQEVLQWLTENGLEVYFPHFIEKGYDTMAVVKHLILEDLDHLKVTLPGHRKALLLAVHALNPCLFFFLFYFVPLQYKS